MTQFYIAGKPIDLDALEVFPTLPTSQSDAWLFDQYRTVRLVTAVRGIRVHTDGRRLGDRPASALKGRWIAIGDVVQTSGELRNSRALPGAFTHVAEAVIAAQTVLNIGVCSRLEKCDGSGGEFQAEYVSGPDIAFMPYAGKVWHDGAGRA